MWAGRLHQMTSSGLFQHQPFCGSVKQSCITGCWTPFNSRMLKSTGVVECMGPSIAVLSPWRAKNMLMSYHCLILSVRFFFSLAEYQWEKVLGQKKGIKEREKSWTVVRVVTIPRGPWLGLVRLIPAAAMPGLCGGDAHTCLFFTLHLSPTLSPALFSEMFVLLSLLQWWPCSCCSWLKSSSRCWALVGITLARFWLPTTDWFTCIDYLK